MKLEIRLKSFESKLLLGALKEIDELSNNHVENIEKSCFVFPTRRKDFTVLRSPHVHKKSREQFHLEKHKALYVLHFVENDEAIINKWISYLKTIKLLGVQIHITLINNTYLFTH